MDSPGMGFPPEADHRKVGYSVHRRASGGAGHKEVEAGYFAHRTEWLMPAESVVRVFEHKEAETGCSAHRQSALWEFAVRAPMLDCSVHRTVMQEVAGGFVHRVTAGLGAEAPARLDHTT